MLDARFRIVEADAEFRAQFGDPASILGLALDEIVAKRDRRGAHALAMRISRYRGEPIDLSLVIALDQQEHFVQLRLASADGQLVAYVEPGDRDGSLT